MLGLTKTDFNLQVSCRNTEEANVKYINECVSQKKINFIFQQVINDLTTSNKQLNPL